MVNKKPKKKVGEKRRVILDFETEEMATAFLGHFCDGGGEDGYYTSLETHEGYGAVFNYDKAFPGWGYNSRRDGPDRIVRIQKGGKIDCGLQPRDEIS